MKKNLFPYLSRISLILGLMISAPLAHADTIKKQKKSIATASKYYHAGLKAAKAGDAESAIKYLEASLKLAPNSGRIKAALLDVKANTKSINTNARKIALSKVMLPKLSLNEATAEEAVSALNKLVEAASNDAVIPNFIISDPDGKFDNRIVTINLQNIPAPTALDYILRKIGGRVSYDEYTSTISPLAKAGQ